MQQKLTFHEYLLLFVAFLCVVIFGTLPTIYEILYKSSLLFYIESAILIPSLWLLRKS